MRSIVLVLMLTWPAVATGQRNSYRVIENWPQLPAGFVWGEVIGVEVDSAGNVYVLHRCSNGEGTGNGTCAGRSEPPVLKFDSSGKFLGSWGVGMFVYPHGFHIDPDGFIWATDARAAGGRGQQVYKFTSDGTLVLRIGTAGTSGEGPYLFNGPTDVAVAHNGDVFVTDGHFGNARIVKFSKDGTFVKAWGKRGSGRGEFNVPHTIAIDSTGRLFVGDRSNNRIQIFDQDGNFLEEWKQFGRPSNIHIDRADTIYVTDSESNAERNPGWERGIRIGSAKDGSVKEFIDNTDPEGVTSDARGNVYSAVVTRKKLDKYFKD
jgi:sugar lactone lactonase YvrE